MSTIRPLEELTLMDDYMFGVVMQDSALLQTLLEMILDLKIRSIRFVESQRTMKEKYQSKAVRLDLYVEDENGHIYNVEVQTTNKRNLPKRMRYFGDETEKIVVNTRGTVGEISPALLETIGYLNNGAVTGEYSDKLDQAVNSVKQSEERRHEYVVTMIREREIREDTREEERRKVALNLRRMGMSDEMIAKALQVPQSIIREWLSDGEGQ